MVPADWRIIKCEQAGLCGEEWVKEKKIESCGVFYLVDVSLHVHICSMTPSLEAWALIPYVTFTEDPEDDGETASEIEQELMIDESVSYFGTEAANWPNKPASKYINIPEQEEGEDDEKYRARVADEMREQLIGNPCWF